MVSGFRGFMILWFVGFKDFGFQGLWVLWFLGFRGGFKELFHAVYICVGDICLQCPS